MNILAVDSSGPVASVAVMRGGVLAHEIVGQHGLTHSETLMPMIDQALTASRLTCADIDLYACVAGPGSFTGVRIGVCAVKGMAHASGKQCLGLNALEVLAAGAYGFDGLICPILDARRGQVYAAAFAYDGGDAPMRALPDRALPLADYFDCLPPDQTLYFTGDGVSVHERTIADRFGARALIAPAHLRILRASAACTLARARVDQATDAAGLLPIYLRAPQAERERAERMKGDGAHAGW